LRQDPHGANFHMGRAAKVKPEKPQGAKSQAAWGVAASEPPLKLVPRQKHPVLLAAISLVLVAWIALLAYLALWN
jgi:hypothetical protein